MVSSCSSDQFLTNENLVPDKMWFSAKANAILFTKIRIKVINNKNWLQYILQAGYCWIAIQFGGLDCEWQSKVKIGFGIVNPVMSFQSKSRISKLFYQKIKISCSNNEARLLVIKNACFFVSRVNRAFLKTWDLFPTYFITYVSIESFLIVCSGLLIIALLRAVTH